MPYREVSAIEFSNGSIPFRIVAHLYKSKTPGLARVPVRDQVTR